MLERDKRQERLNRYSGVDTTFLNGNETLTTVLALQAHELFVRVVVVVNTAETSGTRIVSVRCVAWTSPFEVAISTECRVG